MYERPAPGLTPPLGGTATKQFSIKPLRLNLLEKGRLSIYQSKMGGRAVINTQDSHGYMAWYSVFSRLKEEKAEL